MPAPLVSALTYLMAPRALNALSDTATNARMDALLPKLQSLGLSYEEIQKELYSDPYLTALRLISKDPFTGQRPLGSGLEETARSLMDLYNANTRQQTPEPPNPYEPDTGRTVGDLLAGRGLNDPNVQPGVYVTRGSPYSEDLQFLTPMDDFLHYGGRDDDAGRYFQAQSYGQTDQPATEVRFDGPVNPPDVLADRDAAMDYGYAYPHANPYVQRGEQFLAPMEDFLRYGGRDDDENRQFQAQSYGQTDQPATQVSYGGGGGANGGLAALIRKKNAKR